MHDILRPWSLELRELVRTAALAPSLHNSQPWLFHPERDHLELLADRERWLPVSDRGGRELRIACGAALFNLQLAIMAAGVRPVVTVLPDPRRPELIARVRLGGRRRPSPEEQRLHAAIPRRHTNRRPFFPTPVTPAECCELRRAATDEGCWLHMVVEPDDRATLAALARRAHEMQLADAAFRAELSAWTGRDSRRADGVPAGAGGPSPPPDDLWLLRDFGSGGDPHASPPTGSPAAEPLIAVLSTHCDGDREDVRAGAALQRILLTATAHGLVVSFLSQLVEVDVIREEVRRLIGGTRPAQVALRIGHGAPVPATLRRPPEELLVADAVLVPTPGTSGAP